MNRLMVTIGLVAICSCAGKTPPAQTAPAQTNGDVEESTEDAPPALGDVAFELDGEGAGGSLAEAIGDARVVVLGEQSHGDGATLTTKVELVKRLHEEMGFDVLLFESDFYGCQTAAQMIAGQQGQGDSAGRLAMERCVFGLWSKSAQLEPLWSYLWDAAATDDPIEIGGFDSKLTTKASRKGVLKRLRQVDEASVRNALKEAAPTITRLLESPRKFSWSEGEEAKLEALVAAIDTHDGCAPCGATDRPESGILARNVLAYARTMATLNRLLKEHGAKIESEASAAELNNVRDAQMAENLLWSLRNRYPDDRVIVWTASLHAARDLSAVQGPRFDGMVPMGAHLASELGDEMVSVAFVAGGGEFGYPGQPARPIDAPKDGSFEQEAMAADLQQAYIDLSTLKRDTPYPARPLGHEYFTADWSAVFDAFVFHRTMTPNSAITE